RRASPRSPAGRGPTAPREPAPCTLTVGFACGGHREGNRPSLEPLVELRCLQLFQRVLVEGLVRAPRIDLALELDGAFSGRVPKLGAVALDLRVRVGIAARDEAGDERLPVAEVHAFGPRFEGFEMIRRRVIPRGRPGYARACR